MIDTYMQKRLFMTTSDIERLKHLLNSSLPLSGNIGMDALEREFDRAEVVTRDTISKNAVTVNSRMRLHDFDRGMEFACSIVFPAEANSDQWRLTVLDPSGPALPGYRVGQTVRFLTSGGSRRVQIKTNELQPEAAARERVEA